MGVSSLMRLRAWRFLGLVLVVTWLCMCPSVSAAGSLSGSAGTDPSTPSNSPPPPTTTPPPPTTTPPTTPPSPPTTTPPPTTTAPPTTTPPTTAPPTTTPPATAPTTPSTTPLTPEAGVPDTTAPPTTPTPTTTAPTTTAPVPSTTAPTASPNASPTPTTTPKSGSVSRSITPEAGNQDAQPNSAPESTSAPSSSSGQSYMGIIIAVGVVAIVVLLALFYVAKRHKNRKDDQDLEQMAQLDLELGDSAYAMVSGHQADEVPKENINSHNSYNSYNSHDKAEYRGSREVFSRSPASWSSSRTTAAGSGSESEPLSSIWKNPEILAARIPYEKIRVRDLISRGGFGEVYEGVYHGERVAVKRLLSENRRRLACLEEFMKEAQLLATLEHERIVSFVGVAWDSPRDLCVVLEFMSNGDLRSILAEWRELGRKTGWADVRKVRIALHVAEALTYLHTLNPKIVHRDLKSKNVLVNEHWDAKLSDFGVSREESTHNTMTSNVGSSLWIAPEVMMGNNYDEKADIFSFGVVLSELDSLQLPYHNVLTPDGRKVPDAALLHMVTLGKIQAEFSSMSRTDIVLLGRACLSLDPAMRPSAGEVRYRLSQILSTY